LRVRIQTIRRPAHQRLLKKCEVRVGGNIEARGELVTVEYALSVSGGFGDAMVSASGLGLGTRVKEVGTQGFESQHLVNMEEGTKSNVTLDLICYSCGSD
jgi:hypothetical protein